MPSRSKLLAFSMVVLSCVILVGSILFTRHVREERRIAALPFVQIMNAPEGTYTDLTGTTRSLAEYKGKRILMMAWASWSPQSGDQLALLARIAEETKTSLPLLAINRKEPPEMARLYLDTVGKHDRLVYLIDREDHAFKISEGFGMPEYVIYGEDGAELYHARGTLTEDEFRTMFETYK